MNLLHTILHVGQGSRTLYKRISVSFILAVLVAGGLTPVFAAPPEGVPGAAVAAQGTTTPTEKRPVLDASISSKRTLVPLVESERMPDRVRTDAVPTVISAEPIADQVPAGTISRMSAAAALPTETLGPNLIVNPSLEDAATASTPRGWLRGGYGSSTRVFTYPVAGAEGAKAIRVEVSNYTTGDAKWYFEDVPVEAGAQYEYTDLYQASRESILTARYRLSSGAYQYPTLSVLPASSSFTTASVRFTVPTGVTSMTVFHLVKGAGTLTTDAYSLRKVEQSGGGGGTGNLVLNGSFEAGVSGAPESWRKGGWGTNDRTFTYPATGVSGSRAAQVTMTSRTSGDAKWYTDPINVSAGPYVYEDSYTANTTTYLTVEYQYTNGSVTYDDVATLAQQSSFARARASFTVPAGVGAVRVFHLLNRAGTLTIDDVSLMPADGAGGIFSTGGISLTFDDGWLSQYRYAVPKLDGAGLKATFYITSQQTYDNGYTGFMSRAQVKELYNAGHEIGAHTRTHRALTSLTLAEREQEIAGSRADIRSWGMEPVNVFAYPFGDYDAATIDIARGAGYVSARSTRNGYTLQTEDPYQIPRFSVENTTTVAEAAAWIDAAVANKRWGVVVFHQVDTNGLKYTVTPEIFNGIIDHVVAGKVPVVSMEEGVQALMR